MRCDGIVESLEGQVSLCHHSARARAVSEPPLPPSPALDGPCSTRGLGGCACQGGGGTAVAAPGRDGHEVLPGLGAAACMCSPLHPQVVPPRSSAGRRAGQLARLSGGGQALLQSEGAHCMPPRCLSSPFNPWVKVHSGQSSRGAYSLPSFVVAEALPPPHSLRIAVGMAPANGLAHSALTKRGNRWS